ncbi:MAG: hypothetical protein E6G97_18650 [Alphaproteobacteria bacterium]|nr:MAG: hypothetical protein E6G97_18650 [Alphaproteobacteria bacterium]
MSNQEKATGEWVAWQSMGHKGPGRWSRRHFTRDGKHAVCGRPIPEKSQVFRFNTGVGEGICPRCERTATQAEKKAGKEEPAAKLVTMKSKATFPQTHYAVALLFAKGAAEYLASPIVSGECPLLPDEVYARALKFALEHWPDQLGPPAQWTIKLKTYSYLMQTTSSSTTPDRSPDMVFNPSLGRMVSKADSAYLDIALPPQRGQKNKAAPDVEGVADLD